MKIIKAIQQLKQQWQSSINTPTYECVVSTFIIYEEDPDLHAAAPIYEWEQTEMGQWVLKNSSPKPMYEYMPDVNVFGYRYVIKAYLTEKQLVYFKLKFG